MIDYLYEIRLNSKFTTIFLTSAFLILVFFVVIKSDFGFLYGYLCLGFRFVGKTQAARDNVLLIHACGGPVILVPENLGVYYAYDF